MYNQTHLPGFLLKARVILSCGGEKVLVDEGRAYIVGNPETACALRELAQERCIVPYARGWRIVGFPFKSDDDAIALFDSAQEIAGRAAS